MPQRYVHESYNSWASPPLSLRWQEGFFPNRDEYLIANIACQSPDGIGYTASFLCVNCGVLVEEY